MKCTNCGDIVVIPIFYKNHTLCERCHYLTRLPLYTLTRLWTTTSLYDPQERTYFPDGLRVLESCGFKLFNHKTFFSKRKSPSYREVLTFRYYGKLACGRIKRHVWPRYTIKCSQDICSS